MIIMLFIMFNMAIMALDQFKASDQYNRILESFNLFFIAIFTAESLLKLFALRIHYFREPWNVFDFVVVSIPSTGKISIKLFVSTFFIAQTSITQKLDQIPLTSGILFSRLTL
jgi:voltage-gated sodium channel type II alpha